MRAFFVTSTLLSGLEVSHVTDRTGYTTAKMVAAYTRDMRKWKQLGEVAQGDLDTAIPELALGLPDDGTPNGPPQGELRRRVTRVSGREGT